MQSLALSDDEAAKVKAGTFMQTVNLDWSQLQVQGISETLKKYGVTVTDVASAEYQVDKPIETGFGGVAIASRFRLLFAAQGGPSEP